MDYELPKKSKIKLIVTDLDGTLLDPTGHITEKTRSVINEILNQNPCLHLVIATGRTKHAIERIREELGITKRQNTECITNNGCVIYDSNGNITWQNVLPRDFIIKYHELLHSHPDAVFRYTYGNYLVTFCKKWAEKAHNLMQENAKVVDRDEHIEKIKLGDESDINKVSYLYKGPECDEIFLELEKLRKEYDLEFIRPSPLIVEYLPPKTNKGTSVARIMQKLNISKDEVIAFADGGNDFDLLQTVGWPVAVENACGELKQYAKIITKPNSEDGVAYILEKIFLSDTNSTSKNKNTNKSTKNIPKSTAGNSNYKKRMANSTNANKKGTNIKNSIKNPTTNTTNITKKPITNYPANHYIKGIVSSTNTSTDKASNKSINTITTIKSRTNSISNKNAMSPVSTSNNNIKSRTNSIINKSRTNSVSNSNNNIKSRTNSITNKINLIKSRTNSISTKTNMIKSRTNSISTKTNMIKSRTNSLANNSNNTNSKAIMQNKRNSSIIANI